MRLINTFCVRLTYFRVAVPCRFCAPPPEIKETTSRPLNGTRIRITLIRQAGRHSKYSFNIGNRPKIWREKIEFLKMPRISTRLPFDSCLFNDQFHPPRPTRRKHNNTQPAPRPAGVTSKNSPYVFRKLSLSILFVRGYVLFAACFCLLSI